MMKSFPGRLGNKWQRGLAPRPLKTVALLLPAFYAGCLRASAAPAAGGAAAKAGSLLQVLSMVGFLLGITLVTLAAISLSGGWYRLSRRYPAPRPFDDGQEFRMQSVAIGGMFGSYNNILMVRVGPQGLYLACPFPVNFMHPPMLIPWTEVKSAQWKKLLFRDTFQLTVGSPGQAVILVKPPLIEAVKPRVTSVTRASQM